MTQQSVGVTVSRTELQIGADREAGRGDRFAVTNPADGEVIAEVVGASPEQVHRAVVAARRAMDQGLGSAAERSAGLHRLADVLEANAEEILHLSVAEVGTPVSTARDLHVTTPIEILRWIADATLEDRTADLGANDGRGATHTVVHQRPVGVVAGITAYNYPMLFNLMKGGSAFAAGCSIVLLCSPQAPLSTLRFADFVAEAELPPGAVNVLAGGIPTSQALIGERQVAKVSFTGSVVAGSAVMKLAADGIRDVVLELGGKSAAIVLPSADLEQVTEPIHYRYLRNAGQGCASPTRILVPQERLVEFTELSRRVFAEVVVGDPTDPDTLVGPVISEQHRRRVQSYIDGAVADGAAVLASGPLPETAAGWWVRPTLLGGLPNSATLNQEEVFGPVASVQPYRSVEEAVTIANDSTYGLHASVYGDLAEARAIAPRLEVGLVTINGAGRTRPDVPNGGWKQSGIGRERGHEGIAEYLETVAVQWPV